MKVRTQMFTGLCMILVQDQLSFMSLQGNYIYFINAYSSKEVIFTGGATESINLLSYSLEKKIQKGDEILLSHMEHHANIVPWQQLAKRCGAQLKYLPLTDSGDLDHLR